MSELHSDFCECGDYLKHFKRPCTDTGVGTDDAEVGGDLTDAILEEGIEAAELIAAAVEAAG